VRTDLTAWVLYSASALILILGGVAWYFEEKPMRRLQREAKELRREREAWEAGQPFKPPRR
jgi:peptidoglycan/LPS O-acetylase OafA/YrhL